MPTSKLPPRKGPDIKSTRNMSRKWRKSYSQYTRHIIAAVPKIAEVLFSPDPLYTALIERERATKGWDGHE